MGHASRCFSSRRPLLSVLALTLLTSAMPARAWGEEPGTSRREEGRGAGHVLRLDGPEAYIDLGRKDGAADGVTVTLYRRVTAVHPETGARLQDRFRLVEVTIAEAGEVLSLLRLPPEAAAMVTVGDEARLPHALIEAPGLPMTGEEAPPDEKPAPDAPLIGPDLEAFTSTFAAAAGVDLDRRLDEWRAFLHAYPDSDLAPLVSREIAAIQRALEEDLPPPPAPVSRPSVSVVAPGTVVHGELARVVMTSLEERAPSSGTLHFRRPGQDAFRFKPMAPYGDGALQAEIPAALAEPPFVEWFVTAKDEMGTEHRVGSAGVRRIMVEPRPDAPARVDRSRVNLAFQYVDFYRFRHLDAYGQFEADFLYRTLYPLRKTGAALPQLYSLRIGFGAFHGTGGPVDSVVEAAEGDHRRGLREVGFNFGFTELELRFAESLAFMGRGIVGIADDGLDFGVQGSVRLGPELGTNLVLGALTVGEIGQTWLLRLSWDTVPSVPMSASVEVTTWPVGGSDPGVRLLYEARYRFTPWFELGGRIGYGLRNINHGGMTLGIGTVFSW